MFVYDLTCDRQWTEWWLCFFFFQAEDGIRDIGVTGVQTCALPISTYAPGLRSWKTEAPSRLRGRARRWARRRPVRSASAITASLAAGIVQPRCRGATTIFPPGSARFVVPDAIEKSRPRSRRSELSRWA